MSGILPNLGAFMSFALLSIFVQNAVFARGFGVSRLVKLVGDSTVDSMVFCALLTLIQVISAPMAYWVNNYLQNPHVWYRSYVRPLSLVLCAIVAFAVVLAAIVLIRPVNMKEMVAVLPMATFNTAVLGPMLISGTQNFTFAQTMGFALGSGIGYTFAVLIVSEGQRKMNNRNVPSTFKGLPINLVYIGILALAIYGLTGHRLFI